MLNARSFSKIIAAEPDKLDWCVGEYVDMLKRIHGTLVPEGKLPDMRETAVGWADFVKDYLPEDAGRKLAALMQAVPHDDHMIHGDYHTKNLELQGDEVLLIDMDTLAVGHPVFELGSIFNAFIGFSEYDHEIIKKFQGFDYETAAAFWQRFLTEYLGTDNEEKVRSVEDKARIVGYTRLIRRSIRRGGMDTEQGRAEIELWKSELLELLDRTDSLLFEGNELNLEATAENLPRVTAFIEDQLEKAGCPARELMFISVAAEEIFVNIAHYAYAPGTGEVRIRTALSEKNSSIKVTFMDRGVRFDPLSLKDPDITLPADDREIGGLGIYMTKETMDQLEYEYKEGWNILTLSKAF